MSLSQSFLTALGPEAGSAAPGPDLDARLDALVRASAAAFTTFTVPSEEYVAYIGARVAGEADPVAALDTLCAADLYLACGCARGDAAAVQELDRRCISKVSSPIEPRSAAADDELRQALRARLLVAEAGAAPKITLYKGRGALGAWVRIAATRLALNLHRSVRTPVAGEAEAEAPLAAPQTDPEILYLKARYGEDFREAFDATLASLSARDASLLQLYFIENMTAEALARMYRVSVRTVHRWVVSIRQQILDTLHGRLEKRLQISSSQLESLMYIMRTELHQSLEKLVPRTPPQG